MNTRKIVITGGPGTGKTSIINELIKRGYVCFEEISRQVTINARKDGIEHLFKTDPLLFSEKLLEGRTDQFIEAKNHESPIIFLDRGIPDVLAYMDYVKSNYPQKFIDSCEKYKYDFVFVLAPWQEIFISDEVRYENFNEAKEIHNHLVKTYNKYGYCLVDVPFNSVEERTDYIINHIKG